MSGQNEIERWQFGAGKTGVQIQPQIHPGGFAILQPVSIIDEYVRLNPTTTVALARQFAGENGMSGLIGLQQAWVQWLSGIPLLLVALLSLVPWARGRWLVAAPLYSVSLMLTCYIWFQRLPVMARYRELDIPKYFRGDAAFAIPKLMTVLTMMIGLVPAILLTTSMILAWRFPMQGGNTMILVAGATGMVGGQVCRLLVSTNLLHWVSLATNSIGSNGTAHFNDTFGIGACRYYRLVMP